MRENTKEQDSERVLRSSNFTRVVLLGRVRFRNRPDNGSSGVLAIGFGLCCPLAGCRNGGSTPPRRAARAKELREIGQC